MTVISPLGKVAVQSDQTSASFISTGSRSNGGVSGSVSQSGTATAGNSDSSSEMPQTSVIPDAMKQYMQEFTGMMQATMQTTLDRQMREFVQTTLKRKRPDTDSEGSESEESGDEEGAESPAAKVAHVAESDILVVQENASADIVICQQLY